MCVDDPSIGPRCENCLERSRDQYMIQSVPDKPSADEFALVCQKCFRSAYEWIGKRGWKEAWSDSGVKMVSEDSALFRAIIAHFAARPDLTMRVFEAQLTREAVLAYRNCLDAATCLGINEHRAQDAVSGELVRIRNEKPYRPPAASRIDPVSQKRRRIGIGRVTGKISHFAEK